MMATDYWRLPSRTVCSWCPPSVMGSWLLHANGFFVSMTMDRSPKRCRTQRRANNSNNQQYCHFDPSRQSY